jgi:hypothetical protein
MSVYATFKGVSIGAVGSIEHAIIRLQEDNAKLRKLIEDHDVRMRTHITELHLAIYLDLPKYLILTVITFL